MYPIFMFMFSDVFSLRSKLRKKVAEPSHLQPGRFLEYSWRSDDEEPVPRDISLHLLKLQDVDCLALRCVTSKVGAEKSFVFLLNPYEPDVWAAVDTWINCNMFEVRSQWWRCSASTVCEQDKLVLQARYAVRDKTLSDKLATAIKELARSRRLEAEIAKQLRIKRPMYLSVVETPMMLKSLEPANPKAVRDWKKSQAALLADNEGIWR